MSASPDTHLVLHEVPVRFPCAPYACQTEYMSRVLQALTQGQNALLESPTGTGKTMALLCSALAWQTHVNSTLAASTKVKLEVKLEYAAGPAGASSAVSSLAPAGAPVGSPVVVYASRTHAQLQQVVQELKKSSYRPRVVVLGSRDQLCVNDYLRARRLKGQMLDQACGTLCAQHKCTHRNNLDAHKKDREPPPLIMDIEDAVAFGRRTSTCPYFASRDSADAADLLLAPYNYLLDSAIRGTLKVDWKRVVVIFDEAHNLEEAAASAASFEFSTLDLSACEKELQNASVLVSGSPSTPNQPSRTDIAFLIKVVLELARRAEAIPLEPEDGVLSRDLDGVFLLDLFVAAQVAVDKAGEVASAMKRCAELLVDASIASIGEGTGRAPMQPKLLGLARCVEQLFKTYRMCSYRELRVVCADYRLYVREECNAGTPLARTKRSLSFWAFCGGVAMEELRGLGIRTMIMTSGTLAPLASFRDDMRIPFGVSLENPHVIASHQLWAGAVSQGPSRIKLNSSFNARDSDLYRDEVGSSVLGICEGMRAQGAFAGSTAVAGGVLVFFPSYGVMAGILERWKQTNLYERLLEANGQVVAEESANRGVSKGKKATGAGGAAGKRGGGAAAEPEVDVEQEEERKADSVLAAFNGALARYGRCLLLAVCRGKVSEGIDFKDSRARAVVIVGIPFAPFKEPRVAMKMKYLDQKLRERADAARPSQSSNPYGQFFASSIPSQPVAAVVPTGKAISGREWYNQSAIRAVNQAVGRIIRHKRDWGAVFLLDERYASDANLSLLSSWVRAGVKKWDSFAPALAASRGFFSKCSTDPHLQVAVASTVQPADSNVVKYDQFKRRVELSENAVNGREEGSVFVDPSLLLSQKPSQPPPQRSSTAPVKRVDLSALVPPRSGGAASVVTVLFRKPAAPPVKAKVPPPRDPHQWMNALNLPARPLLASAPPLSTASSQSQGVSSQSTTAATMASFTQGGRRDREEVSLELPLYEPSKRAKLMSASGDSSAPPRPLAKTAPKNSLLAAALLERKPSAASKSFGIVAVSRAEAATASSQSTGTQKAAAQFGCLVCCTESLTARGVARCGHVCCLDCWEKWLRKSRTCPSCRAPTAESDVSRLSIR